MDGAANEIPRPDAAPNGPNFLAGGGEMGALMRAHDWASTSLGAPESWPLPLRVAVQLMLNTNHPMYIWWGEEDLCFYNDAYSQSIGPERHPSSLGRPAKEVWFEIWHIIGPQIEQVKAGRGATWNENHLVPITRYGRREDVYWTYGYSPIGDDNAVNGVGGVLVLCTETTEVFRGNEALRVSEARLHDVLDNMGEGLVLLDRDFRIVHMNAEADRLEERPREEVIGKTHWEAHPDAAPELEGLYRKAMADRCAISLDHRYVWPNGRDTWIGMRAFPVGDGLAVFYRDISEQKHARAALEESEARFRQIADSAPVPMWVSLLDRTRSFVNAAYMKFLGGSYENAVNFDWREILHPDDHVRITAESIAGEASLKPFVLEGRYRRGDGEWRSLQSHSQPRFDADGKHSGFIGVAHDVTEARQAEAILRESEERFREQFENANDFIFTTDLEMRITSCNPAVARALQRDPDQLIGRRISEFTPPETWEQNKTMLAAKLAGKGDASRYEVEVYGLEDEPMTWEINSRLVRDGSGTPVGLHAIARDVTERRQSEDALNARNNRLNLLARIAGALVLDKTSDERLEAVYIDIAHEIGAEYYLGYLVDEDQPDRLSLSASFGLTEEQRGTFSTLEFNENLCGMVAATRKAVVLNNIDQINDISCRGLQTLGGLSYAGFPLIAEGRLIGTVAFSSSSRSAFSPEEVALVGTVADQIAAALDRSRIVAELSLAREAAEADAAEQSAILGQLAEGVVITDADGRITFVNDAATKLHGVAALDVDPSQYSESYRLFREDGSPYPSEELPLSRAILLGETVRDERWKIRRPDGSEVLAIGNAQPVLGPDGKATGAVLTVRDDTGRHSAELALRELNDTLELRVAERTAALEHAQEALRQSQKLEAMGQLTGGVAHDFNNLLTPILGSLDLLHRRQLGGPREQMLIDGALQSAERAKTLVQRLLAFARRQPLNPTAVDIGKLVGGLENLFVSTLGPHISLDIKIDKTLPSARGDANQLEMALLNLSVNARDAMPESGKLVISASLDEVEIGQRPDLAPGEYILLAVNDNGSGMDTETLTRSIEPFFSTKGIGKGTGLGLSMVHGLASQLGGSMTVTSELGEGTTVMIWLPVTEAENEPIGRPTAKAEPRRFSGTVLLVDDEPVVRGSTSDMLSDMGFDVIEAGSAEKAIIMLDQLPDIQLLVTDHLMPGMTGAKLAETFRTQRPGVPALIITGYAEADGVPIDLPRLNKPFRQSELAAILTELVGKAPPVT